MIIFVTKLVKRTCNSVNVMAMRYNHWQSWKLLGKWVISHSQFGFLLVHKDKRFGRSNVWWKEIWRRYTKLVLELNKFKWENKIYSLQYSYCNRLWTIISVVIPIPIDCYTCYMLLLGNKITFIGRFLIRHLINHYLKLSDNSSYYFEYIH